MTYTPDLPTFIIPNPTGHPDCRLMQLSAAGQALLLPGSLPFPFLSHLSNRSHATDSRWVVGIRSGPLAGEPQPERIVRRRIGPDGRLMQLPDMELPRFQRVKCVLLHNDWLYIGGGYDYQTRQATAADRPHEFLHRLKLSEEAPVLEPVPLPVEFGADKAIDDLLRDGDELLVVDDVVSPKYLFFYQLQPDDRLPQWQRTHQLPFRRPTDLIDYAAWSASFIALRSASAHQNGGGTHVSVLRRSDLKPVFVVTTQYAPTYNRDGTRIVRTQEQWMLRGLALQDNQLLLACGSRGLACVQLHVAPLWPRKRTSYQTWDLNTINGRCEMGKSRRVRETRLAEDLDLRTATAADGVAWLPLAVGQPPVETVLFVGQDLVLLTGRHNRRQAMTVWLRHLKTGETTMVNEVPM